MPGKASIRDDRYLAMVHFPLTVAVNELGHEGLSSLLRPHEPSGTGAATPQLVPSHPQPRCVTDTGSRLASARILILDDCSLNRENLAAIVAANYSSAPSVAWDLPSLLASLDEAAPDIVLLSMITRHSGAMVGLVHEKCPRAKVIVTDVAEDDEAVIVDCAEAGVVGYHLQTESLNDLLILISKVIDGESYCSPGVSAVLIKRLSIMAARRQPEVKELTLTAREIQILRMLEVGLSNRDIADQLCIALHTVKNHVHNVLNKLGVSSRAEAAAYSRSPRYDDVRLKGLGTVSA
jgi:DNA-binding NarL/FixJ family response regulator